MKRKKHSIPTTRASQRCNKATGKGKRKVDDETESHQFFPYFANIPSHITTHLLLPSVAMKRKKHSIYPSRASQTCNEAKETHRLYPYFAIIPSHLVAQILLQLPIKSLLICRCVCKMWKTLISEPHFAKLHFQQSPTSLMIRTNDSNRVSRTLHLLESEPEKFEIGSNNHVRLAPIFKLPLRDARLLREKFMNKPKRPLRAVRLVSEKNNKNSDGGSQMLNNDIDPYDDKFGVVNSCNGLLCLCRPFEGNPLVICNPVIGEFIRLPKATNTPNPLRKLEQVGFGFGFQPKTNEFKVIQIWKKFVRGVYPRVLERMILDINTLGTPSWRSVEVDPQVSNSRLKYPTCLNGVIHWIRFEGQNRSILCFCLESERLQSFPSPPHVFRNHNRISRNKRISIGESRGLLYICDTSSFHDVTMWVMKEYGIGESWTKVYSIDTSISSLGKPWRRYGVLLCWPLKHFEDGASMLLYHSCNCLVYYEPEKYVFKVFRIHGTDSESIQIIPHTPSLISLKDAVKGDSIEVLNIYSMCANVKLREENEVLSLSQQLV